MLLDVKLKGLANEDLVQGFPGVPATWPRIAGTVELRVLPQGKDSSRIAPVDVLSVSVALFRTDSIVVPSHRPSVAAQKREKSFLVTRQKEIYRKDLNEPGGTGPVFALDVPFTLSFPTNKPPTASMSLSKTLESTYNAIVTVEVMSTVTHQPVSTSYQFPVRVKRFDTLRTFGTYKQPIAGEQPSSDHLVSLEWSLPVSAYGPGDTIGISLKAEPNRDWPKSKKVKMKRVSVELVQKTRYMVALDDPNAPNSNAASNTNTPNASTNSAPNHHSASNSVASNSSGVPSSSIPHNSNNPQLNVEQHEEFINTRTRVTKVSKDFTSSEQDRRVGMENVLQLDMVVPSAAQLLEKDSILPKEQPWVGYDGRTAFTNQSALFNIEFALVFKARLSHAKDIEAEQEITLSQFDHFACTSYMNNLVESAQRLKHLDLRPHPPRAWKEALDTQVRII